MPARPGCDWKWPPRLDHPDESCAVFLRTSIEVHGTGHSFMALMVAVEAAASHGLTLDVALPGSHFATAHNALGQLLGEHPFSNASSACTQISGSFLDWRSTNMSEELAQAVRSAQLRCAERCVAIHMGGQASPIGRPAPVWSVPSLRARWAASSVSTPPSNQDSGRLHVDVHIRRGDLFHHLSLLFRPEPIDHRKREAFLRLIPNAAYAELLRTVAATAVEGAGWSGGLAVTIHAEGRSRPTATVIDADGASWTDFDEIARTAAGGQARVSLGPRDPLEAFRSMCYTDVLLAAPSGFSHLVSLLCPRPLVLAVPFWHEYDCVPNAHMLRRAANASVDVALPDPGFNLARYPHLNRTLRPRFDLTARLEPPSNLAALLHSVVAGKRRRSQRHDGAGNVSA